MTEESDVHGKSKLNVANKRCRDQSEESSSDQEGGGSIISVTKPCACIKSRSGLGARILLTILYYNFSHVEKWPEIKNSVQETSWHAQPFKFHNWVYTWHKVKTLHLMG